MNTTNNSIEVKFPGAAGNQFGRNTYLTVIPFKSVERFLTVFPEVQRKINMSRVKQIAQYVIQGTLDRNYSFLSAVTASCRGAIRYDDETKQVSIDINSTLSINDGQHRIAGIKMALDTMKKDISKETDDSIKGNLMKRLERLENMHIPIVIFDKMDEQHEQQLFHDLNLLAAKPTKSVSLKFDNTDPYTLMAKEVSQDNHYLIKYGVETEKTQLRDNNPNLMLLSTLRNMISFIIAGNDKDKGSEDTLCLGNYDAWKNEIEEILDLLFESLPNDCNDRTKYIIGLAVTLQGIGKYIHSVRNGDDLNWKDYLAGLKDINWKHNNRMWNGYGGSYDDRLERFVFGGTGGGINGVCNALVENNRSKTITTSN
ncbi:DNA sulfur modification protein DndB [Paenibacillus gansuensis]|uniref:DNA sulfur modification protein DndB n=1 Tax=Paenibacillus gansuensis TaxID=306542 RepID=A0ABW5P6A8_9BACL